MDRISDSGSDGCGSIPHGGTKAETAAAVSAFVRYILLMSTPTTLKTLIMSL